MLREIVKIDEEKCDGCGLCVPACAEGAIRIIDGKARLVSDRLCDGLGACLGHCPRDAITIEQREADEFDEAAVAQAAAAPPPTTVHGHGGCPGSRLMQFGPRPAGPRPGPVGGAPSELTHWPVQLRLLPAHAPVLQGASLLLAADCAPVACADFHQRLLRGRVVLVSCPKFDDLNATVAKLTEVMRQNDLAEVVIARMEVPCCTGLVLAAVEARRAARARVPLREVVVNVNGELIGERTLPVEAVA